MRSCGSETNKTMWKNILWSCSESPKDLSDAHEAKMCVINNRQLLFVRRRNVTVEENVNRKISFTPYPRVLFNSTASGCRSKSSSSMSCSKTCSTGCRSSLCLWNCALSNTPQPRMLMVLGLCLAFASASCVCLLDLVPASLARLCLSLLQRFV